MMITTDSPRLTVTPGEWYASDVFAQIRRDLRHTYDISAVDCNAVERNDLIFRRLSLPPEDVSTGCDGKYGSLQIDSAAAESGAVELDDLIFRRLSFPPEEFAAGWDTAAAACGAVKLDDMIFRRTNLPPDEFSAGRNGHYIWRDLWTGPSVCNRPVTGSHGFGSSHRLEQCCLWLAALPFCWMGNAEVPLSHHLLPAVSRRTSQEGETPFHFHLCQVYPRDSFMEFLPPCFRLILTFSYCLYDFLREQELEIGGSHITDKADSFHGQIRWEKLNTFVPDSQDVKELWAVRPHVIFVKMIYTLGSRRTFQSDLALCGLHELLRLHVADVHEGISEKVSGTVSTSAFMCDMTVMSSSGVIVSPSDVSVGQLQPLTTVVSCTDAAIMVTPFVVPPSPDIEQPCRQLQDFLTCQTPESRQPSLLCSLSAVSSACTLPWKLPKFSSSSSSIDRFQPLRRESSRPTGDTLLPPSADNCLLQGVDTPKTVGRCEPFPGSEYPSSLPACATVRLVLSAGPSGASDWVGCQDLYYTAGGITYLCIGHCLVRPFRSDDSPIRRIRRYETSSPLYAHVIGVRRSAVFRWKPGVRITASSYSALRQRRMSGVVPSPFSACHSRVDLGYCSSPLQLDDYTFVI